ncbi:MAG: aldolase [Acidobacteriaceae bacterium]|nr:aldolase [Acidobacteriaceae bacterium]
MPVEIALEPTINDPLLTRVPLDYDAVFYPYGFPVRLRSNSRLTIEAADISWSTYRRKFDCPPLDVRLLIAESNRPGCAEPPVFRSQGNLLSIVADAENFACLDLNAGFSFGWATISTARKTEYFRQCLLDVMIYPLLEVRHLITLHAACVMWNGKGVLLAGDSGAGKSSLAYACSRRGWTYVSDDASAFIRAARTPMVIGHPQKFRFREPVGALFPEFRDLKSTLRAYGKPTIEVQTRSLEGLRTADESPVNAVVFLDRPGHEAGPPALLPVPLEDAWKRLSFSVWAVQSTAYEERLAALQRMLTVPTYRIRYAELDPAIDCLQRFVETELC